MKLFLLLLLLLPSSTLAATRDNLFNWTQECLTTQGDDLDLDDDGICELLTGFRFYDPSGGFITGIVEDGTRSFNVRYNMPWGLNQCHTMTAIMNDPITPGQVNESVMSNIKACRDVTPGNPNAPVLLD